jgi:quercetin dioxygenase-like cupin family protein
MKAEYSVEQVRDMSPADRARFDAQVSGRTIRFSEVEPNWLLSPNCRIPGFERGNYVYVGGGSYLDWTERAPSLGGAQVPGDHFSCVILLCEPGKGAPLHAHTTEEMFLVLSGEWVVFWGDDGQHETVLHQWDAVSFPGPAMRGFRNISDADAHLLSVIGGGSPPPPIAHPAVTETLRQLGLGSTWPETHAAERGDGQT